MCGAPRHRRGRGLARPPRPFEPDAGQFSLRSGAPRRANNQGLTLRVARAAVLCRNSRRPAPSMELEPRLSPRFGAAGLVYTRNVEPLRDSWGREIKSVRVSVTDKCNFR